MAIKKVLICVRDGVLGAGIEHLLCSQNDLNLLFIKDADEDAFSRSTQYFQPDVVIIDEHLYLGNMNKLSYLLWENKPIFVILLSAHDNYLHVFQRKDVLLEQASDLVSLIRTH